VKSLCYTARANLQGEKNMIYEMRTYDLKPGSLAEVEKRFGEAYEKRKQLSELAAFWHTEIGPLNQIIHVWPYKDLNERTAIREAAVKSGNWPPRIGEFIVNMRSDIMVPFSCSPELKPGKIGPFFEIRTYSFAAGELGKAMKLWEKVLPPRLAFSPLAGVWYSDVGALNRFCHIWAYPTLDARTDVRNRTQAAGVWPPSAVAKRDGLQGYELVSQENKIVMPSSFSPVQ
jgi:hypothetical protein